MSDLDASQVAQAKGGSQFKSETDTWFQKTLTAREISCDVARMRQPGKMRHGRQGLRAAWQCCNAALLFQV